MTANVLQPATAQHRLLPKRHHGVAVSIVVAVIVAMVVTGSLVHAMEFPPTSAATPGQVRLPNPRPLPPVHMPPADVPAP
jgi:hypothetical protein